MAMRLVHEAMERAGPDAGHDAHFICALSLAWPDGHIESFEGRVDGLIVWPPRGTKGFGYDPIFQPIGRNQTFGEIEPDRSEERRGGKEWGSTCRSRRTA